MSQNQPLKRPPGYRDQNLPIQRPPQAPNNLPPTFYPYQRRKKSHCCRNCCFCLCIFIFLLALLLICLGGFFFVWYEPKLPEFAMKSFQLDKFNVTNSNDGPKLNTQLTVKMEFQNTNKNIKLEYDKISVLVNSQDGVNLGEGIVPGFLQGVNNVTTVKFTIKGNQLVSEHVSKSLTDEFKSKSLKLTTEVTSGIGMILNGWNTGTVGVKVICGDTTLKQIQGGATPKCSVYMFRLLYVY